VIHHLLSLVGACYSSAALGAHEGGNAPAATREEEEKQVHGDTQIDDSESKHESKDEEVMIESKFPTPTEVAPRAVAGGAGSTRTSAAEGLGAETGTAAAATVAGWHERRCSKIMDWERRDLISCEFVMVLRHLADAHSSWRSAIRDHFLCCLDEWPLRVEMGAGSELTEYYREVLSVLGVLGGHVDILRVGGRVVKPVKPCPPDGPVLGGDARVAAAKQKGGKNAKGAPGRVPVITQHTTAVLALRGALPPPSQHVGGSSVAASVANQRTSMASILSVEAPATCTLAVGRNDHGDEDANASQGGGKEGGGGGATATFCAWAPTACTDLPAKRATLGRSMRVVPCVWSPRSPRTRCS
jgi:hypothetical protein